MVEIPVVNTHVKISTGNKGSLNDAFADGQSVQVISYSTIYYGRTCSFDKGGVYENDQYVVVENAKGQRTQMSTSNLSAIDGISEMMARRPKENRRLGDLPDTKFWEMDTVKDEEGEIVKVQHIWYDQIGEFCNDGVTPMSIYACGLDGNGVTYRRESSLSLVERGNVWKRAHGEDMSFMSTRDEIDFYILVGDAKEMPNPRLETGRYHWTKTAALESIRDGYGHYFLDKAHSMVLEFDDEKVGAMARDYWLKHNDPKYDLHEDYTPSI